MADSRYIVELILKARDDTAAAFAKATGQLDDFNRQQERSKQAAKESAREYAELNKNLKDLDRTQQDLEKSGRLLTKQEIETINAKKQMAKEAAKYVDLVKQENVSKERLSNANERLEKSHARLVVALQKEREWSQAIARSQATRIQNNAIEEAQSQRREKHQERLGRLQTEALQARSKVITALNNQRAQEEADAHREALSMEAERARIIEENHRARVEQAHAEWEAEKAINQQRFEAEQQRIRVINSLSKQRFDEEEGRQKQLISSLKSFDREIERATQASTRARMADVSTPEGERVRVIAELETTEALAEAAALKTAIEGMLHHIEANIDIDTLKATTEGARFVAEWEAMRASIEKSMDVDLRAHVDKTSAARAEAELKALSRDRKAEIKVDVDRTARSKFGQLMDVFNRRVEGSVQQSAAQIAAFDNLIRGMAALLITAFLEPLMALIFAAGGALAALASSAAAAGAALGGALAAGIAQVLPGLGILAIAAQRISGVFDAVKQANLLAQQESYKGATAARTQANALDAVRSAQERVADAQRNVQKQTEALTKAREEARKKLEDLILTERGAVISAEEAQNALQAAIASGEGSLAVERGALGVDRAAGDLSDTREEIRQRRAGGIEKSPEVEQAKEQLADAQRALVQAQRGLEQAKRSQTEAAAGTSAAAGKLDYLLSQMSTAERKLYESATRFQKFFSGPNGFAARVTEPLIVGFAESIDKVRGILSRNDVFSALRGLSEGLAGMFQKIFDAFTSPEAIKVFLVFIKEATANLEPLGNIIINLGKAFLNIGLVANPVLRQFLDWIAEVTKKFADFTASTEGQNKLADLFQLGIDSFKAWMSLLGAIGRLFLAIVGPGGGAESGISLLEMMTDAITNLAKEIEKPGSKINEFVKGIFRATEAIAKTLGPVLADIAEALVKIFVEDGPAAVEDLGVIFQRFLIPVFEQFIGFLSFALDLARRFLELPLVSETTAFGVAFVASFSVLHRLKTFVDPVTASVRALGDVWKYARIEAQLGEKASQQAIDKMMKEQSLWATIKKERITRGEVKPGGAVVAPPSPATRGSKFFEKLTPIAPIGGTAGVAGAAGGASALAIAAVAVAAVAAIVALIAYAGKLDDVWRAIKDGAEQAFNALKEAFQSINDSFKKLTEAVGLGSGGLSDFLKLLGRIAAFIVIVLIKGAFAGLVLVITQISASISGFIAIIATLIQGVRDYVSGIIRGIKQIFSGDVKQGLTTIGKSILGLLLLPFKAGLAGIKAMIGAFGNTVKDLMLSMAEGVLKGVKFLTDAAEHVPILGGLFGKASNAIQGIIDDIRRQRDAIRKANAEEDRKDMEADQAAAEKRYIAQRGQQRFLRTGQRNPLFDDPKRGGKKSQSAKNEVTAAQAESFLGSFDQETIKLSEEITKKLSRFWERLRTTTRRSMEYIVDKIRDMKNDSNRYFNMWVTNAITDLNRFRTAADNRLSKNSNSFVNTVRNAMQDAAKAVYDGAKYMNSVLNESLGSLGGTKPVKISIVAPNIGKKAIGGFIGNMGERGRDVVPALLGRGEAVLNWGHQKLVEPALNAYYGFGLNKLFNRTSGFHAGGTEQPGFAQGGFTGPGHSGEGFTPVWNLAKSKFGMTYFTGYDGHNKQTSSGNTSDHWYRRALDMGNGILTAQEDALNNFFKQKLPQTVKQLIWRDVDQFRGFPVSGHRDHVHLAMFDKFAFNASLMAKLISRASRGLDISALLAGFGGTEFIDRVLLGGKGQMKDVGQKTLDKIREAANAMLDRVAGTSLGGPEVAGTHYDGELNRTFQRNGGATISFDQAVALARQAGFPAGVARLFGHVAVSESGLRPGVVNSIGATGLWQIYNHPDLVRKYGDMRNPWNNARAAFDLWQQGGMQPWVSSQGGWGQFASKGGFMGLQKFDMGGIVRGVLGDAVPVVAHAGEWILNKVQQAKLAEYMGTSISGLKRSLGFSGGPDHFEGGGEISTRRFERQFAYQAPSVPELDFGGIYREIKKVTDVLKSLNLHKFKLETDKFLTSIRIITGDQGLLARLFTSLATTTDRTRTRLALWANGFTRVRGRLEKMGTADFFAKGNPVNIAKEEVELQNTILRRLRAIRKQAVDAINRVNARIKRAERRGDDDLEDDLKKIDEEIHDIELHGVKGNEKKELARLKSRRQRLARRQKNYQGLIAERTGLQQDLDKTDEDLATALQARFESEKNLFEEQKKAALAEPTRNARRAEHNKKIADLLGGDSQGALQEGLNAAIATRDVLKQKMDEAKEKAKTDPRWIEIADGLTDDWLGAVETVAEKTSEMLQGVVDAVTKQFDRKEFWRGLILRRADLAERISGSNRYSAMRTRVDQSADRVTDLRNQKVGFTAAMEIAGSEGNWKVWGELRDKIADLEVTIDEEIQMQRELILQYRQTQTELISGRGQRSGGLIGQAGQIFVNALKERDQETTAQEIATNQAQKVVLTNEHGEIAGNVGAAFGSTEFDGAGDNILTKLLAAFSTGDPNTFASVLQSLAPEIASLESTMGEVERTAFTGLVDSMVNNTIALQDNSLALKELTEAQESDTQSWLSTAWQMFRQPIFTGTGLLLPQYASPQQMHNGGLVTKGGIFELELGERVIDRTSAGTRQEVNINIDEAETVIDPVKLGNQIAFTLKHA